MKTLVAIAMYIMLTVMSANAAISTHIPPVVHQPVVKATLLVTDLFPYAGCRTVSVNGMIVQKDFDETYTAIVHLVNGSNFIRIVVVDGQHKYHKTKKVVYTRWWTKGKFSAAAPISHKRSQLNLLKDTILRPDKDTDTRTKYSVNGKPPIPFDLPFLKKNTNFDINVSMKKRF